MIQWKENLEFLGVVLLFALIMSYFAWALNQAGVDFGGDRWNQELWIVEGYYIRETQEAQEND